MKFEIFFFFSVDAYIRLLSFKGDYLTTNEDKKYVFPSKQLSNNNLWIMKHDAGKNYTFQNVATHKFLHRPDVKIDVSPGTDTTSSTSFRNTWKLKVLSAAAIALQNATIQLQSWHSDYLHRNNGNLITTWQVGQGNNWRLMIENGKIVNTV